MAGALTFHAVSIQDIAQEKTTSKRLGLQEFVYHMGLVMGARKNMEWPQRLGPMC